MRKIAFLAIVLALIVTANVKWGSAGSASRAGELLDVLPDGNVVAIIDFQKLAASNLWTAISSQQKFKGSLDKVDSEMAELGVKLSDVNTIALVFSSLSLNSPAVAVTGQFQQNDLLARLRAGGKMKLTSERYKNFDIYKAETISASVESKDQAKETNQASELKSLAAGARKTAVNKDGTAFVFHGSNIIVAGSLEAVRASIDVKTGAKPGIAQNGKLAGALAQNPAAAIRFALTVTPAMTSGLQSSELPIPDFSSISLIFGTIDVASGIDLNATLRSDTAEHAKSIADRLSGLLAMAAGYLGAMSDPKMTPIGEALKTVKITSANADVKITGSVSIDLLNSLLSPSGRKS